MQTLMVNEIFYSIQGEGSWTGCPCVFVRLMGCHLRCHYCDTAYAFHEGSRHTVDQILDRMERLSSICPLVEITGGEPLLQPHVHDLMLHLCDEGKTVLLETSGACNISSCDPRVIRILDIKTPGSGEVDRNLWVNIEHLRVRDEIKFILCDRADYEWARELIHRRQLHRLVGTILMSPVHEVVPSPEVEGRSSLPIGDLAEWILRDGLQVRLQTQLHKLIWDPLERGR